VTDFEDTGGSFFLDHACQQPDPLTDDQAIYFDTTQGTVVVLGCAHAGVINTLYYVRQLTHDRPVHAVLGGMHLINASSERLQWTIEQLRKLGVERLGPAHCTGTAAVAALWNAFPGQCFDCHAGTRLEFEVP
jgi:7,8-dihydropterin-6-yl-methyl-4-(beta-D-ribofuranosyl)aminobenzene 5'-phosphate synthase